MYHIVYKTTNTVNGKYYIGLHSTVNIEDDYLGCGHWRGRKICDINLSPILNAFKKYGDDSFIKEILFIFETREEALTKEHELVNIADKMCYNARAGGGSNYNYTDQAKQKMSESAKERSKRILTQTNILIEYSKWKTGKTYTEIYGEEKGKEVSLKSSRSLTGRKLSDTHKRKMSENRKGKDCGKCTGRVYVWDEIGSKLLRITKSDLLNQIQSGYIIERLHSVNKFRKVKFIKII
jgi:group I intron endonuclease